MSGVDYAFNAAALKQVPSCEFFPWQAVATNVPGSDNVIRAAHATQVVHRRRGGVPVSGERLAIINMPTFWVHSITNTGTQPFFRVHR